ncbi:restriction endonuclease [Texcoconibacillus texcoconensis]|uniref:Restriction system protein n=1 Tax=Texcoconibacillus texcoconensis TaxID=1095777 RepID=A0A840QTE0_9BACI|nr:restriction endonuclease [Texcoconibacillus texcoconensis]MBB5174537.1 restriction system protein [Texcoconibacillus texcoconensis]
MSNAAYVIGGVFLIGALSLYWLVFNSSNVYIFFGILFATVLIQRLTENVLSKKKTTAKKQTRKKKANTRSNQLRSDKEMISTPLEELSWREFERLCYLYFKTRGFKPQETSEGADGGVDLILYNRYHHAYEAVQIKHYINSGRQITVKEIRELHAAKRNHKCKLTMFITTSGFTQDALRQADDYHMDCCSYNWVNNHIVKWQEKQRMKEV